MQARTGDISLSAKSAKICLQLCRCPRLAHLGLSWPFLFTAACELDCLREDQGHLGRTRSVPLRKRLSVLDFGSSCPSVTFCPHFKMMLIQKGAPAWPSGGVRPRVCQWLPRLGPNGGTSS